MSALQLLLLAAAGSASALSYRIPSSPPYTNSSSNLVANPVGVSIEFFTFPEYFSTVVPSTAQCLANLKDVSGIWPPLRIGGTTQDRATYAPTQSEAVNYTVASPTDAPTTLTFGPSFMSLADTYDGQVILGLNRELNNQPNTIDAAAEAIKEMKNLKAIELGNEPDFYTSSSPIAGDSGTWTAAQDFASQVSWQDAVCQNLSKTDFISAGVYFGVSSFNISGLTAVEGDANQYVRDYCSHNYPQSATTADLETLMSHSAIGLQIAEFKSEIEAADREGKYHIMGETNSATGGGGGISPTFGAGLWIVDYVMQALILGTKALYFHQGTIGDCEYCWWGRYDMGAPYYGAYFVTMALAGADHIAMLDDGATNYAAYAIYQSEKPIRVLLYNSDYYTSGTRPSQNFTLTGIQSSSVTSTLLTAPYATSRQDEGSNPSVGGQMFVNGTCAIEGTAERSMTTVSSGTAQFTLGASEALLIEL